jgi:hypothetical protein
MKRWLSFFIAVLLAAALVLPAGAVTAQPTGSTVLVDGEKVDFVAYNIDGSNYFKLRDIAQALSGSQASFEVGWDGEKSVISLQKGPAYTAVGGELSGTAVADPQPVRTGAALTIDGKPFGIAAYNIADNNFFKLRDLAAVLDFGVGWDESANTIAIDTGESYVMPDSVYGGSAVNSYYLLMAGKDLAEIEEHLGTGQETGTDGGRSFECGITLGFSSDTEDEPYAVSVTGTLEKLISNCPDTLTFPELQELFGAAYLSFDEMDQAYCTVADYGGYSVYLYGDKSGGVTKDSFFFYSVSNPYAEPADLNGLWTGGGVELTISDYTAATLTASFTQGEGEDAVTFETLFYAAEDGTYRGYWFYDSLGNRCEASLTFAEDGSAKLTVTVTKAAGEEENSAACDAVLFPAEP